MSIEQIIQVIKKEKIEVDKTRLKNIEVFMEKNKDTNLKDIELIGYQNHNPNKANNSGGKSESGFVGYALKDKEGNRAILFRGSEDPLKWGNLKTDWYGNLAAGIGFETKQHKEAEKFYQKFTKNFYGETTIFGHSKGGSLVTHVFLENFTDNVSAYIVNGAPIFYWGLTDLEKALLETDRFEFITYTGDIVSHLGLAPYVDKIVIPNKLGEILDPFYFHYETSSDFNEKDGSFARWYDPGEWQTLEGILDLSYLIINTDIFILNKIYVVEEAIKRAVLEIVFFTAKGIYQLVSDTMDQCLKFLVSVNNLTQEFLTAVAEFLVNIANQTKRLFSKIIESTKRFISQVEEKIIVDISRLHYYIERLNAVKRRAARVNDMIDDLYRDAGIFGIDNVFKADICTKFNISLTHSINYLSSTADTFETIESMLSNKAAKF